MNDGEKKTAQRQPIQDRNADKRDKSKSRSRSRDGDTRMEEKMVYRYGYWCKEKKDESRHHRDSSHRHRETSDDHKKEKPIKRRGERTRIEEPCIFFNNYGYCSSESGHSWGPHDRIYARLHICSICFRKQGKKKSHPAVDCSSERKNSFKDSPREDGVTSKDSPRRDRVTSKDSPRRDRVTSNDSLRRDRVTSKDSARRDRVTSNDSPRRDRVTYNDSPRRDRVTSKDSQRRDRMTSNDSPRRDRLTSKESDEKPCTYFNNNGDCRKGSGHLSRAGFIKQHHICSCCLEFRGEVNHHSALTCELKKKLTGGWKEVTAEMRNKFPCHSYNTGKCFLQCGHSNLGGITKMVHICTFCFEYRGENNTHTEKRCKLKNKLLLEVKKSNEDLYGEEEEGVCKTKINEERSGGRYDTKSVYCEKEGVDVTTKAENEKRHKRTKRKCVHEKQTDIDTKILIGKSYESIYCKEEEGIDETTKAEKDGRHKRTKRKERTDTDCLNSKEFMQFDEANNSNVKPSATSETPLYVSRLKDTNRNNIENIINQSESNVNKISNDSNIQGCLDVNPGDKLLDKTGLDSTTAAKLGKEQGNVSKKIKNVSTVNTSQNTIKNVKKRRKLERSNPQAIIHLNDSKMPTPHISTKVDEEMDTNEKGKTVLRYLLCPDNVKVEDSDTEINDQDKIIKKIKILEKLHAIELEKLREARGTEEKQLDNRKVVDTIINNSMD